MDVRVELQKLNNLLSCPNFTDIPRLLRKIRIAHASRLPVVSRPRTKRKK